MDDKVRHLKERPGGKDQDGKDRDAEKPRSEQFKDDEPVEPFQAWSSP